MTIRNDKTAGVFLMPKIDRAYINRAKKSELKVLLALFACGGRTDLTALCEEVAEDESTVLAALAFWRAAGVIEDEEDFDASEDEARAPKTAESRVSVTASAAGSPVATPSYTLEEIAAHREKNEEYASLLAYLEKLAGKPYNAAEQGIVLFLYDTVGMPYDYLMGVARHCVSLGKNAVRYFEKTALSIWDEGVHTYTELETYFDSRKKRNDFEAAVKDIIGANDRALSKAERAHLARWETEFAASVDLVSAAYDRTVAAIGKPRIAYMTKILEDWHAKGLSTPEEVAAFYQDGKTGGKTGDGRLDFDLEDIFEKPPVG